jgi:MerR family transcriptional regulator, heat shock protein HspR
MEPKIIPRDEVVRHLSVTSRVLLRYEGRGLVRPARQGAVEGYTPEEVRRLWTIVTFQRDLGINLAGVEAILQLQSQMADLRRRLDDLAARLREADMPGEEEHEAEADAGAEGRAGTQGHG